MNIDKMSYDRSPSPASLNSLQIALVSMKERCQKQQKRIDALEKDNRLLNSGQNNSEVKKLRELNLSLREKNIQLNHELIEKNKECTEMKEELESVRVTKVRNARNAWTTSMDTQPLPEEDNPTMLMSLADDTESMSTDATKEQKLLNKAGTDMTSIKEAALNQRKSILNAIQTLKQRQEVSALNAESLISASLATAQKLSTISISSGEADGTTEKKCPMCEATFPEDATQDAFECHVVEHFSYEEADTLKHFDMVPDAWDGMHGIHGVLHDDRDSSSR